eukprot:2547491-Rhodomonas_salina.2
MVLWPSFINPIITVITAITISSITISRGQAAQLWEPPLEDVPHSTTTVTTPMLIFIVQGGGGVGARHTIAGRHGMPPYDKPCRIISSNPTRLEGREEGSVARRLRRIEQSCRMYHALWLSPKVTQPCRAVPGHSRCTRAKSYAVRCFTAAQ